MARGYPSGGETNSSFFLFTSLFQTHTSIISSLGVRKTHAPVGREGRQTRRFQLLKRLSYGTIQHPRVSLSPICFYTDCVKANKRRAVGFDLEAPLCSDVSLPACLLRGSNAPRRNGGGR